MAEDQKEPEHGARRLIVEIGTSGEADMSDDDGCEITSEHAAFSDIAACCAPGDAEPALVYLLSAYEIEFRTVAAKSGMALGEYEYENRLATHDEKATACEEIYCDSDSPFRESERLCELYLLWQATADVVEGDSEEAARECTVTEEP